MLFKVILIVCFLVLAPTAAQAQSRTVQPEVFEQTVKRRVDGTVMGYSFAIADRNGIVASTAGGWAQAPGDGSQRMTTSTPIGFGSNQKVLSGVALLDLLEDRSGSGLTVDQELNTPIRFFMPDKWRENYFASGNSNLLNRVTLRDILDHTSGLADEPASGGEHGTKIALALSRGVSAVEFMNNTFDYENGNYTLLLYIIPALAFGDRISQSEQAFANLELAEYNRRMARVFGALYTQYMTQTFLRKVPVTLNATCRPGDLSSGHYAKQYASRNSQRGATDNAANFCRSQGSWSYSVESMAHIWRTMEFGNRIVSRSTRELYNVQLPVPRLIYPRTFTHQFLGQETDVNRFRGHGGRTPAVGGMGDRANSVTVRLPWGYVGMAAVNSDELSANTLATTLMDAFYAATRQPYEAGTDRPGNDIDAINLSVPDPERCEARCDDNDACRSWSYVPPGLQHPTRARCWLKDNIPVKRVNANVVSGVKGLEYGVDRPGADLRKVVLPSNDAAGCRIRCLSTSGCKSWTYVKPGLQQEESVCWLKHSRPSARRSGCCVSGVVR